MDTKQENSDTPWELSDNVPMPESWPVGEAKKIAEHILWGDGKLSCAVKNNEVRIPIKQTGQCQNCGARCGGLFGFCKQCV